MKKLLQNTQYAGMSYSLGGELYAVDHRGCVVMSEPTHVLKAQALGGFRFLKDLEGGEADVPVSTARPGVSSVLAQARRDGVTATDLRRAADLMDAEDRNLTLGSISSLLPNQDPPPGGSRVYKQASPAEMTGVVERRQRVINIPPPPPKRLPSAVEQSMPRALHRLTVPPQAQPTAPLPAIAESAGRRVVTLPSSVPRNNATQTDPALMARA
jgi:hypothetical protein